MIPPEPQDRHAEELSRWTRPPDWRNPTPAKRYNLVVVGAGPAGLVCAAGAARLGARVALVEKYRLGGDCLHFGCVPSKAFIRSARFVAEAKAASELGVANHSKKDIDFSAVMERLRRLRADVAKVDAAKRFADMGIDVFFGAARFVGPETVAVGDSELHFARAVIATGARPADPGLPGLERDKYFTNETIFNLTERPKRLIVIGAGAVGCELAQAFARLGSEVQLVNRSPRILSREDPDAAEIVLQQLHRDGIGLHLGVQLLTGHAQGVRFEQHGKTMSLDADAILIATGRRPNVENLNLQAANVANTENGIMVDDFLRTTNARIFAAGDVCAKQQYTHAADAMARIVLRNALFFGRARWSNVVVPHCTYTDPELASVGMTASQAAERRIPIQTFQISFDEVDRAVVDSEREGFCQVHVRRGTDRIVGATVVGKHAGETIGELVLAMAKRVGLGSLAAVVRAYPTRSNVISKVADAYQRTRLTPFRQRLLTAFLQWRR